MLRGRNRAWRALAAVTALTLLAACSNDSSEESDDTEETEETEAPDTTDAPATTDAPDTTVPATEAPTTTTTTPPTTVAPTLPAQTVPPQTTTPDEPVGGELLLHDDFDDDTNQWGADSLDDEFATGVIADGFLSFSISQSFLDTLPEGQVAVPAVFWPSALDEQAGSMTNVRVETTLVMTPGASAGLACGLDPTIEDQRFYAFNINSAGVAVINEFTADGEFNLLARSPEDIPTDPPAFPEDPAFEYSEDTVYELAAECSLSESGAELVLELDGEVLVTASDTEDPIASGTVGVNYGESTLINAVEGFQPFGVVFDTFDVFDLGESTTDDGETLIDDEFEDDSNEWGPRDTEFTTGELADGAMRFEWHTDSVDESDNVLTDLYWPSVLEDVSAELSDVRVETAVSFGRGGVVSVFCGVDPVSPDDFSGYEFTLASSGVVSIVEYAPDGTPSQLARLPEVNSETSDPNTPVLPDEPAFEHDPEQVYDLAGECRLGDGAAQLTLELDGEVLLEVEDTEDALDAGIVGVSFSQSRLLRAIEGFQPFDVVFESFRAFDLGASDDGGDEPAGGAFQTECIDETGDLTDDKGNPIDEVQGPGTDLTGVFLDSDGEALTIVWQVAEQPQMVAPEDGLRWEVDLFLDGGEVISIIAFQDGDAFQGRVSSNLVDGIDFDIESHLLGTTVMVEVPVADLGLPAEFEWSAFTQISPFEIDFCPSDFGQIAVPA